MEIFAIYLLKKKLAIINIIFYNNLKYFITYDIYKKKRLYYCFLINLKVYLKIIFISISLIICKFINLWNTNIIQIFKHKIFFYLILTFIRLF